MKLNKYTFYRSVIVSKVAITRFFMYNQGTFGELNEPIPQNACYKLQDYNSNSLSSLPSSGVKTTLCRSLTALPSVLNKENADLLIGTVTVFKKVFPMNLEALTEKILRARIISLKCHIIVAFISDCFYALFSLKSWNIYNFIWLNTKQFPLMECWLKIKYLLAEVINNS